jgi:undecaprenyl-diphosphatase
MKKSKLFSLITASLFLLFIIFTLLVKLVGVQPAGPLGSKIGFASLNEKIFSKLGVNQTMYGVTEKLGLFTFLIMGAFVVLGLVQLIKGKSFKSVDYKIWALGAFYVIVLAFYVLFEIIIINYRPVLIENELEASYPSSHTLLSICIVSSAMIVLKDLIKNKPLKITAFIVGGVLMAVMVVGRLISGVHWFTDILGGIILSLALVSLFYTTILILKDKLCK